MGIHNSSKTRVTPAFGDLYEGDRTGASWVPELLKLPLHGNAFDPPAGCDFRIYRHFWGENEIKLKPPLALLSWLIRHPEQLAKSRGASRPQLLKERAELLAGSNARSLEALSLLRSDANGENWYIFEGESHPDVFIETPDLIVVVEGKRKETRPTTDTEWMPVRHQMLRHIDDAWEIRGRKQVSGFFVVEAEETRGQVPAKWQQFAKDTISRNAVSLSLPHRSSEEQDAIASCFAGVTTWQRLCHEFKIDYGSLPDEASG